MSGVTTRDIYLALAKTPFGKPNKAKTWKDVNGKLPALPIRVYGPPPTSGTRDALGELIMTAGCEANPAMAAMKKANEAKYKAICTGVREDGAYHRGRRERQSDRPEARGQTGTIGIFGYSYLEENADQLKGIAINGVPPTYQTISAFKYPGARPLYIYVKNAHVGGDPGDPRLSLRSSPRRARSAPTAICCKRGLIAAPNADPRPQPAGRARPRSAQFRRASNSGPQSRQQHARPSGDGARPPANEEAGEREIA